MDAMKKQLILLFCSTALLLASPFVDCRILALTGIIFAAVMYFVFNIRYFSIGTAVLSLLYGFSIIPVSAFAGPLVMVLFGEVLRTLFYKTGHSLAVFGAGSAAALIFAMVYTHEFEPLVGSLAILVLLMLRSILGEREDGSMLSLVGVSMTIVLFEDLEFLVDLRTLAFAILLCAAFGYFAYRAKTIDLTGVFSAVLFGVILISFTGAVTWFIVLLVFFILGSAFTKFKYSEKEFLGVAQGKHGKRGYKNAFANAGVGVAAAILYGVTGDLLYACIGSLLLHLEVECSACHNLLVGELEVGDGLAVELHFLHIDAFVGLVGSIDDKVLSACKVQGCLFVERCTDDIFC